MTTTYRAGKHNHHVLAYLYTTLQAARRELNSARRAIGEDRLSKAGRAFKACAQAAATYTNEKTNC